MVVPAGRESQKIPKKIQVRNYAIALITVSLVLAARLALAPILGTSAPLILFVLAVTLSAYIGGLGPGLLASAASVLLGTALFVRGPLSLPTQITLILYVTVNVVISVVCDKLRESVFAAADSEARVRESEEANRALMESAAQGIVGIDQSGRMVIVNAMAEQLFGYPREEMLGQPIELLLPEGLRQTHQQHRASYFDAPRNRPMGVGMALSACRKDGSEFPVEISLSSVHTRKGRLAVSFITDITSRRLAEQERENFLREIAHERSRLRAVLDQMPVGVIIGENPGARLILHNREAERLLTHPIRISTAGDIFGAEHEDGTRFDVEQYPLVRALNGEITQQKEIRYRLDANKTTTLSVSAAPIRDSDGLIVAAATTFTDISGQKHAQQERERLLREIAESRALLDSMFENAPIGLGVYDRDLRFVRLNDALAEINGIPKEDHLGRTVPELLPDVPVDVIEYFHHVFQTGEAILNREVAGMTPAHPGQLRQWSASYFPVKTDGDVLYCGAVVEEITSLKESERTLRDLNHILESANEDLRQFAYAASHDLQEPLRMVTSYTQLLERRYRDSLDDNARQYIDYAVTGALRIENLLRGLREYWQASEVIPRQPVWTDCNAVVDRSLMHLEALVRETNAVITRDPLPTVLVDETPLLQLFQNLISNALKYRHPDRNPTVQIRATAEAGEWIFSVHDNGIGIDPRYARQVFGIFKRLNGYRYSGAGMGLAICQKIVERFGGRIWVESELGNGASFYFTIPVENRRPTERTGSVKRLDLLQPQARTDKSVPLGQTSDGTLR